MRFLTSVKGLAAVAVLAAGAYAIPSATAAETKGPVTDEIGVVKIAKGQPMVWGGYWVLSGPDTALGLDQKRGVEIALDDLGHSLFGHEIRLLSEDSACTAEGGQTAATKLASNRRIVIVLGPACSSAATPGAPILWNAGIASIGTSPSAPALTAPDRGPGYDGFIRTIYNDNDGGAFAAEAATEFFKAKTASTVHDGSPYSEQLVRVFEREFKARGGKITSSEAVSPTDTDMRPVLTRIATNPPELIYYPIFVQAGAFITRQSKEIAGLENSKLLGSDAVLSPDFVEAAGKDVVGFNIAGTGVISGSRYDDFKKKYNEKYGEDPIHGFHTNGYDAAMIAAVAILKVAVKDAEGNTYIGRKALRDALYGTTNHPGITGIETCNELGDCAAKVFAVLQFTDSDPESFKLGVNPKQVYPAK
ncbi:MAG: branched-chain amino acid ABC transporter substrate-binding protein [Alphaproteobacteria bacterium]|nr:branched-chain amino acid ABC transporter substrate-binding protein [Alphaproteobacteria bacterium]